MAKAPQDTKIPTVVLDGTTPQDDGQWWLKPDEEIGRFMVATAEKYELGCSPRRDQNRRYTQLFKGQIMGTSVYDSASAREVYEDVTPAWNVIQAAVNTAGSIVVRNKVRVAIMTSGADYVLQDQAEDAEHIVAGIFAGNKVYEEIDPLTFQDASVTGLACTMGEATDDGQVILERVIPDELVFSDAEAMYGKPRQIFRPKWMSRWDVLSRFGDTEERKQAIMQAPTFDLPLRGTQGLTIPLIPVWRGWFLPTKAGMTDEECDGRFVIAIPGGLPGSTLRVKRWKHTRFPLAFFRIEKAPAGLWGIGMAERLAGFQYRIQELNYLIEEAARGGALGKWMVETGSNVNDDEFTDENNAIVHYSKTPPKWELNDGIPTDLTNERTINYQQAFKEYGLSEWTVSGVQPKNLDSGEALDSLREQEQGRAVQPGQYWEAYHVDLAEVSIICALDAVATNKSFAITGEDTKFDGLKRVNVSNVVKLLEDPDSWMVRPWATSILPSSPAGRFETLNRWKADGWIDQTQYAALSDAPDLDEASSHLLAGLKAVRFQLGEIVRKGQKGYEPPDPAMPLQLAATIANATYLKGMRTGLPEDRMALIQTWRDEAIALAAGPQNVPQTLTQSPAQQAAAVGAPDASSQPGGPPPPGVPPEGAAGAGMPVNSGPV